MTDLKKDKKMIPNIRFKGFTDDWEQRKLGDYLSIPEKEDANVQSPNDLMTVKLNLGGLESSGSRSTLSLSATKYYVRHAGQFIYGKQNFFHGSMAIIPKEFEGKATSGDVPTLNIAGISASYLLKYISRPVYWKNKEKEASGTGSKRIHEKTLLSFDVVVPEIAEQQRLAKILITLENLITLHQRKLEGLEELKKLLLQKMFTKNGQNRPDIRLDGFTDDWEQRKFATLLDPNEGIRRGPFGSALKKSLFVKHSEYVVYEQQNAIKDKFDTRYCISKEKYDELNKFILQPGDFIMSGAGTIGRIALVPKGINKGVFNQALIRMRINSGITDPSFFLQFMRSEKMQRSLTEANPASAIQNLVPMSEVKKWDVLVPSKDEESKLGELLDCIDGVITLHQRKLQKLDDVKQLLLQNIFV